MYLESLILANFAGSVGNSGTGETTLFDYTLPGGTLPRLGSAVRVTVFGSLANTANTKTLRVYLGSATPVSVAGTTANVSFWFQMVCSRVDGTNQQCVSFGTWGTSVKDCTVAAQTQTLANNLSLKVTGQSDTASSDVVLKGYIAEVLP